MSAGELERYFELIGSHPVLSQAEAVELAYRVQAGDRAARDKLILANAKLVVRVAKQHQGKGLPLMDLISVGTIGLIRAVDGFDPAHGHAFSTYAVPWIRQKILREIAERSRTVHVPLGVTEILGRYLRLRGCLEGRYSGDRLHRVVCRRLGLSRSERARLRDALKTRKTRSLAVGDYTESDCAVDPGDSPARLLERSEERARLYARLERLDPAHQDLLRRRFGLGCPIESAHAIYSSSGITRDVFRYREERALEAMLSSSGQTSS